MNRLPFEKCESFGNPARKLGYTEIVDLLDRLPSWKLVSKAGIDYLTRTYHFDDYKDALAFTIKIGKLADELDHHPTVLTEWGKVTIKWWTHSLHGLQRTDFIMSAKTDDLYK